MIGEMAAIVPSLGMSAAQRKTPAREKNVLFLI
jgi:hypothetical protein